MSDPRSDDTIGDADISEDTVYCTNCGNVYVKGHPSDRCPVCVVAEEQ
jgi:rubrerythrin